MHENTYIDLYTGEYYRHSSQPSGSFLNLTSGEDCSYDYDKIPDNYLLLPMVDEEYIITQFLDVSQTINTYKDNSAIRRFVNHHKYMPNSFEFWHDLIDDELGRYGKDSVNVSPQAIYAEYLMYLNKQKQNAAMQWCIANHLKYTNKRQISPYTVW